LDISRWYKETIIYLDPSAPDSSWLKTMGVWICLL